VTVSSLSAQPAAYDNIRTFVANSDQAVTNLALGLDTALRSGRQLPKDYVVGKIRDQLFQLNARLASLVGRKEFVISLFKKYLDAPPRTNWSLARRELSVVKNAVQEMLHTIEIASPTLIQVTGPDLITNLTAVSASRSMSVIDELVDLPEPQTESDRAVLRSVVQHMMISSLAGYRADPIYPEIPASNAAEVTSLAAVCSDFCHLSRREVSLERFR
jgi:hypothetical protein